ncbi:MAG: ankyrin repeat domain-containing protein [Deltaproteobacteria bacterium]|nr:ankyrin repeat domain-containing protein [Deltaproteobacteria bacterium]
MFRLLFVFAASFNLFSNLSAQEKSLPKSDDCKIETPSPFYAAKFGDIACFKKAVELGADLNAGPNLIHANGQKEDFYNRLNPFYVAARLGYVEIVDIFIQLHSENKFKFDWKNTKANPVQGLTRQWLYSFFFPEDDSLYTRGELSSKFTSAVIFESKIQNDYERTARVDRSLAAIHILDHFRKEINLEVTEDDSGTGIRTPLMNAAQSGTFEVAKIFIERGADVNAKNPQNCTSLNIASEATWGYGDIEGRAKLVELLIEKGADIENRCVSNYNRTALISASMQGLLPVVKVLLKNKADVNAVDASEESAFSLAATNSNSFETVIALLDAQSDINHLNDENETALDRIRRNYWSLQTHMKNIRSSNSGDKSSATWKKMQDLIVTRGAKANQREEKNYLPIK